MNKPSMAEMSGEKASSPRLELNKLQFSGKKNNFELIDIIGGLKDIPGKSKKQYSKTNLGESVSVIFLRVRRKLNQFRKDQRNLSTNEHNTTYDMLTLFGDEKVVKGTNAELREKYPGLKTTQVVYCLLKKDDGSYELVRMNVKGSALGSENKAKDTMAFYDYVASFKKDGADEHAYEYETTVFGVEEESPLGSYYAMTFARGDKVDPQVITDEVEPHMTDVFNFINASDKYYETKKTEENSNEVKQTANAKDEIDTIEYPDDEEEIDLADIPF